MADHTVPRPAPRMAPRRWFAAIVALLFAVQAVAAVPVRADDDVSVLRVAPAAPATVHVRDASGLVQAVARGAAPHGDARGDGPPTPLPVAVAGVSPRVAGARPPRFATPYVLHAGRPGDRYRARAPPARG